ncbi:hypothetical protein LWF01_03015 [Saxibacter everestensis]|uniref:Minor tail protein n=1 Tax=Saxibacter everestensis TaxID=2909229 RepID=A0ABY8QWL2_9MICO|nr:hypothetical protein LWF01_03015 [Brevibacteriaceae bacterium ZFBP1038]
MTTESDALTAVVRREVDKRISDLYALMSVDSPREDGTVNLAIGDQVLPGISADTSYTDRKDGDTVLVLRHPAGWRVLGKVGSEYAPPEVDVPVVSWGNPPPAGNGWVQASVMWVRAGEVYAQRGEGPQLPGEPGPSIPAPKPVTFGPASTSGYRSGNRDGETPAQGAWPSYPKAWSGAWFYGDRIADECVGKSVEKIEVRVARTSKNHGVSGKATARLYMHEERNRTSSRPALSNGYGAAELGLGQSKWVSLPADWTTALKSGTKKGIGCTAGVGSDYLVFTDGCGDIRITFN